MMRALSLSLAFLFIWQISSANDPTCLQFYHELSNLPHTRLIMNSNGFVSLWDGKSLTGCEVLFESDTSMVLGKIVYQKFQSFTTWQGWSINKNLLADGPGSSTVGIENDQNKCTLHWSQHAWIDEETKTLRKSEHIKLIIQCTTK